MKEQPEARAVILGEYIVRQKATVRAAAEWFGVSKSTVHKDVSERLEQISPIYIHRSRKFWSKTNRNAISAAVLPPSESTPCGGSMRKNPYSSTHSETGFAAAYVKRKQFRKSSAISELFCVYFFPQL